MRQKHVADYQWDDEPPERPSEFVPSTGYSVLSSFNTPSTLNARARRQKTSSSWGLKGLIGVVMVLLGICGYVMVEAVKVLQR